MAKKIPELPAMALADMDSANSLMEVADMTTAAGVSKYTTFSLLAQWLRKVGFGLAITAASPAAVAWGFTNGSGIDNAAGNFTMTAPRSTGAATAATLSLATGIVGASSATLQTATNRLSLAPNGVIFGDTTASAATRANFETLGAQQIISYGDSTLGRARYVQVTLGNASVIDCYEYNGTIAVPTASSGTLCAMWGGGYDGASWKQAMVSMNMGVAEAWGVGANGTQITFATTANTTATTATKLTIGPTGLLTHAVTVANSVMQSSTGGSLTGSDASTFWNHAGTWNTSGVPTAFKLNITNTASNAASLLMNLLAGAGGATSMFSVAASGLVSVGTTAVATLATTGLLQVAGSVSNTNPFQTWTTGTGTGALYIDTSNRVNFGTVTAQDLLLLRNNAVVATFGSGLFTLATGMRTSAPNGGTAATWKMGTLVTAGVVPDTTRYVELDVAGTLYKVIIST